MQQVIEQSLPAAVLQLAPKLTEECLIFLVHVRELEDSRPPLANRCGERLVIVGGNEEPGAIASRVDRLSLLFDGKSRARDQRLEASQCRPRP